MSQNILVVDDNALNLKVLTDILEKEGYKVGTTNDGLKVMDIVHENKFDIILLDIIMPKIDGFGVFNLLKEDYETQDIPVIMVTAKTDSQSIKKALELGVFDYIKKPIEEVEVIARVQSALRFKAQLEQLKEMSMKDGLTGLYNHSPFIELFQKELDKNQRVDQGVTFVMLDIDYFKTVNDTYGHQVGDTVLQELSGLLLESVREGDIVGRYGGEEFGIVFLNSQKEGVIRACHRLKNKVENFQFNSQMKKISLTISMGICHKESKERMSSHEMIQQADDALYRAKNKGRNRIEIAEISYP